MTERKNKKRFSLREGVVYFTFYSLLGWIYEVFLEVAVYHWGFTNRGVLFGPYTPVYGFGAITFLLLVYPLIRGKSAKRKLLMLPVVFLACAVIATGIELGTSYLLEFLIGSWPWQTYSDYAIHFQGRIALSPSLRFGLGGVVFLYVLQPLFERLCCRLGKKVVGYLALIFSLIFAVDCLLTVVL